MMEAKYTSKYCVAGQMFTKPFESFAALAAWVQFNGMIWGELTRLPYYQAEHSDGTPLNQRERKSLHEVPGVRERVQVAEAHADLARARHKRTRSAI